MSDAGLWLDWDSTFDYDAGRIVGGGGGFLEGYRTVVDGFHVVQATIEPFGVLLASGAMVWWLRAGMKTV